MTELRVCIDSRFHSGVGGIEQIVIGLASAFSNLEDGNEEYLFLVNEGQQDWLTPYVGGPCRIVKTSGPALVAPPGRLRSSVARALPFLRTAWHRRPGLGRGEYQLPDPDPSIERVNADVGHFPPPGGFRTDAPNIFQPHDLIHLHHPEMFNAREVRSREKRYRAFCEQAALVVMMTSWGSRDLISRYGLPPERVAVVPGSSTLAAYPDPGPDDLQRTEAALGLPERFLFFPAHTWPNKNHIGLIEALAMLRDRDGLRVPLVCSGGKQWFFPEIERAVRDLRMGDQVKFVGFVTPRQLRCLYELATGVIFPSRFEGWGLPVVESFAVGAPLACSTATGLPDIVGDAALKFDPYDLAEIASAARRLWEDDSLRADLVERGRRRAEVFSPERNAKLFRAHYRGLAGRDLSAEDRALREAAPAA